MTRYRARRPLVDAIEYTGANAARIRAWLDDPDITVRELPAVRYPGGGVLQRISVSSSDETGLLWHFVMHVGDRLICSACDSPDEKAEFQHVKRDVFDALYEENR